MNRRDLIASAGVAVAAGGIAFVEQKAFAAGAAAAPGAATGLGPVLAACVEKGEVCIAHCLREMAVGNKDMAKCAQKAHEMVAMCRAVQSLHSYGATARLKEIAQACINACKECADVCAEHKAHWAHKMHLECKDCHDECLKTIDAVKKAYA